MLSIIPRNPINLVTNRADLQLILNNHSCFKISCKSDFSSSSPQHNWKVYICEQLELELNVLKLSVYYKHFAHKLVIKFPCIWNILRYLSNARKHSRLLRQLILIWFPLPLLCCHKLERSKRRSDSSYM